MSASEEQVYISLSLPCSAALISNHEMKSGSNLKGTELRLGLPGSESPERRNGGGFLKLWRDSKDENINGLFQSPSRSFVSGAKRGFCDEMDESGNRDFLSTLDSKIRREEMSQSVKLAEKKNEVANAPVSKAQIVGWPPVRSFWKNTVVTNSSEENSNPAKCASFSFYVKVSMDGAPYLRKIDLKTYSNYTELSSALENMFSCFTIGKYEQNFCGEDPPSERRLMDLLHGSEYVLTYEDKDGDWMLVGDVPWEMFMDSCKRLRITKGSEAVGLAPRSLQKCKIQNL